MSSRALAVPSVHERDIVSAVCQRCARCCELDIKLTPSDSRYRRFLRGVGLSLVPPQPNSDDCCDQVHDVTLHLGPCRHLQKPPVNGETLFFCELFGDNRRPQLCRDFNCVSWAKARNEYHADNAALVAAREAWARTAPAVDVETADVLE